MVRSNASVPESLVASEDSRPIQVLAGSSIIEGPVIGETGFEPATARPPARRSGSPLLLSPRFYWVLSF